MAITTTDVGFYSLSGDRLASGALHRVFAPGVAGGPTDYAFVEVRNTHATLPLTSVKAWLTPDPLGAVVALAVAAGTPVANTTTYSPPSAAGLAYSTPTTEASGISLSDIPAGRKVLLALRRVLGGAGPASPESNILRVTGSSAP